MSKGLRRTLLTAKAKRLALLAEQRLEKLQKTFQLKKRAKRPARMRRPVGRKFTHTMSRVRSAGSEIENRLGKALWCAGVRCIANSIQSLGSRIS